MSRREFTKETKRQALKRSAGICEAVGRRFGLEPGIRCSVSLAFGVRFEHLAPDANSKDNSLDNCAAVCPRCWRWKTDHYDKPMVAKTVRQRDKNDGIRAPKRAWPKRHVNERHRSNVRDINDDLSGEP